MVNATQMLHAVEALGMNIFEDVLEDEIPDRFQSELYEPSFRQSDSPKLREWFSSVNSTRFSILVFDQLHPHIVLFRNRDAATHLRQLLGEADAWIRPPSVEEFWELDPCMKYCRTRSRDYSTTAILKYLHTENCSKIGKSISEADEETTSIDTTKSFEKEENLQKAELEFRFRKRVNYRKGDADSDDRTEKLVHDWGVAAEENPVQRVKTETPEAQPPSITPTIFIQSSERPQDSSSTLGKRPARGNS